MPLVDRLIPGGLEQYLREARERGESFQTIATRLQSEHDIPTTHQTVSAWCTTYGIGKAS